MENFLTESSLKDYLNLIYPNSEWVHDKQFIKGRKVRPDYRSEDLKIIVEFDGYNHYTSASRILSDIENTKLYESLGYKVIRIPYFIQMSSIVIKCLFNVEINIEQTFSHGFISNASSDLLPCDFNSLGIKRFENDLERFSYIKEDIVLSLKNKVSKLNDKRLVLPESLYYLID